MPIVPSARASQVNGNHAAGPVARPSEAEAQHAARKAKTINALLNSEGWTNFLAPLLNAELRRLEDVALNDREMKAESRQLLLHGYWALRDVLAKIEKEHASAAQIVGEWQRGHPVVQKASTVPVAVPDETFQSEPQIGVSVNELLAEAMKGFNPFAPLGEATNPTPTSN